jgi:hypothetical protein
MGELTRIVDQFSLVSGLPAEASGLVSKAQTLLENMTQQSLGQGRTDSTSVLSAAPSGHSTNGTVSPNQ